MIDIGRGVRLVTRAEWGARPPRSTSPLAPSFGTTAHWEGPHMGWPWSHAACSSLVRGIQRFHMDSRGWADIAYSYVACPHAHVFEGRGIGRRTAANGTNHGNNVAYAVCYLGGEGDPFTEGGRRAMRAIFDHLDAHGGAGPGRNCHRDWKATACPGDVICGWVRAGLPVEDPPPSEPEPETPGGKMLYLIKTRSRNEWWLTDWLTKRHIPNREDANVIIYLAAQAGQPVSTGPGNKPHVLPDSQQDVVDRIPTVGDSGGSETAEVAESGEA